MVQFNPNFPFFVVNKESFSHQKGFISSGYNCTASVLAYMVHCCNPGSVLKRVTSCRAMWFGGNNYIKKKSACY